MRTVGNINVVRNEADKMEIEQVERLKGFIKNKLDTLPESGDISLLCGIINLINRNKYKNRWKI